MPKQYFDIGDSGYMQRFKELKDKGKEVDVYVVLRWER